MTAPRIYCVACRRDATVMHHELEFAWHCHIVWFECHGEHRFVRVGIGDVRAAQFSDGAVRSDSVEDLGAEHIKHSLASARARIDEGTRVVHVLERFIAAEQRTRRG